MGVATHLTGGGLTVRRVEIAPNRDTKRLSSWSDKLLQLIAAVLFLNQAVGNVERNPVFSR